MFFGLMGILTAVLLGAMSPGPSFVMVAKIAMSQSRTSALAAAVGMGVGGALFAGLSLFGLQALFESIPLVYHILKILGGLYLVYVGIMMFKGAKEPFCIEGAGAHEQNTAQSAFKKALLIQISNPKTAIFYSSIFAALLPQDIPLYVGIVLPLLVFMVEWGWYCVVVFVLSSRVPREAYLSSKLWIDRVAGGVIGLLGIKLMVSTESW